MFPELIKASCTMFGAWGPAIAHTPGTLLQLRALDWGLGSPLANYSVVVVCVMLACLHARVDFLHSYSLAIASLLHSHWVVVSPASFFLFLLWFPLLRSHWVVVSPASLSLDCGFASQCCSGLRFPRDISVSLPHPSRMLLYTGVLTPQCTHSYHPEADNGHAFASLTWMGFIGSVTAYVEKSGQFGCTAWLQRHVLPFVAWHFWRHVTHL